MTTAIHPDHRAAIDRLPTKPGKCGVAGCNETMTACTLEAWTGDPAPIPPMRFGCPEHDVWLTECFDEGVPDDPEYSDGLWHAVLRDLADPAWDWLPEHVRPAAMRHGFAVTSTVSGVLPYPRFRVGACAGRAWATNGKTLLDVGPAEEVERMLERANIQVVPASKRPEEVARHRLSEEMIARFLNRAVDARPAEPRPAPPEVTALLPGARQVGQTLVPAHAFELVTDIFGAVSWSAAGPHDPVFASRGNVVAVVMPVDPKMLTELAKLAREAA